MKNVGKRHVKSATYETILCTDCGEFDRQRKSRANIFAGGTDTRGDFFMAIGRVRNPVSFPGHSPCYVVVRSYDQNGPSSLDVSGEDLMQASQQQINRITSLSIAFQLHQTCFLFSKIANQACLLW